MPESKHIEYMTEHLEQNSEESQRPKSTNEEEGERDP